MDIFSGQALLLFFCFISSCFFIFTLTRTRKSSGRVSTFPPGPPRLPIIGNIHQVGNNPYRSFADLSKAHGPVMSLKLGCLNSVVISSPEAAREVLKTQDNILSARKSNDASRCLGHNEFSIVWLPPSSARWRMLRKLAVNLVFSPKRTEATKVLRMEKVQELLSFVNTSSEREEAVDISRASYTTVLNVISNILFSVDLGTYDSKNPNEFLYTVVRSLEPVGYPDAANYFPFLGFLDLQGNRKAMKSFMEKLFKVFRGLIDAKKAENLLGENSKDASTIDFLDSLLLLAEGDEAELDNNEIEHLLLDMFEAGTSSSTLEWAMAELLKNPKTMAKAQTEIDRVIGQNGVVQESDLSNLPYLQAVVKETFRLHPAAPLLVPRNAESDVKILGFMVPKDTQVLVNVWAIGRDLNVWENPNQFEPERFLGKDIDVKGRDYELIPFGSGRRICPALPFALKTVPLMLASLLHSFDWKLPNGVAVEDLDMDETFGLTFGLTSHKTKPLHAVPFKKSARN